jgi:hypothetical protein
MLAPVNTPTAIGGLLQAKSATLQYYCCADLDRCSPPRYGQRLHQTEFHIPEHYHTVFASAFLSRFRIILGKLEEPIRLAEGPFCRTIAYWYPSLQCRVDHLFPQVRPRQMNIFEGRFLLLVPHQLLQGRDNHVLVRLVSAKGVPQGMDANPFSDPGLFDVFGDNRFDR